MISPLLTVYFTILLTVTFRLAYADYILTKLAGENQIPSKVNLLYDIGCKLISHWKVSAV